MLCTNPLTGATHLHWVPRTNGWHVELAGAGVQGTVEWSGPAPGRLVARLDHVALVPAETPELAHAAEQAEAVAAKPRSEEHTSELQSLMRISYAVFCLKKKTNKT